MDEGAEGQRRPGWEGTVQAVLYAITVPTLLLALVSASVPGGDFIL